jgi:hypothetical protein
VKKIPPEHPAAKSLEHAFRALGEERARGRQRHRSGRLARLGIATLAPILAVAAVATGTKVFTGDGGTLDPDRSGTKDPAGRHDLSPNDRELAIASAADPSGGPRWGLRTYTSSNGRTCVTVGQVQQGRLGIVRAGQFKETPEGASALCGLKQKDHIVVGRRRDPDGRNILYGVVDRTVHRLHLLRSATGRTAEVGIADDGSFIVVREGRKAFFHELLVVDGSAGRKTLPLDPT